MDSTNFQVFLTESLIDLKKQCRRSNKNILTAVDDCLSSLKKDKNQVKQLDTFFFLPFKLACESRSTALMTIALNSIQKLVATSLQSRPLEDPKFVYDKKSQCMQEVIKAVCDCCLSPKPDVVLKVIQNILTIITSSFDIHSDHLLIAIRTCYHVYLTSKDTLNKTCARATLAQIVHIVFERSSRFTGLFDELAEEYAPESDSNNVFDRIKVTKNIKIDSNDMGPFLLDGSQEKKKICSEIIMQIIRNGVFKEPGGKFGFCIVCHKPAYHFCLQTNDSVCSIDCKVQNLITLAQKTENNSNKRHFLSIVLLTVLYQADSIAIFRSLCELAAKNLENCPNVKNRTFENGEAKPIELQTKELSLELIIHIFKSSCQSIKRSKQFLELIKTELIEMLLQNMFEGLDNINGLTIAIFLELMKNFKTHLKTEIGVFLDCVFGKLVESKNSTFRQKIMSLMVFVKICSSDQTLVDIFLNYDCNSSTFKIYENLISLLEKVTQNKLVVKDWITKEMESQLKVMALECFKRLFQSLLKWAKNAIKMQAESENNGDERDIRSSKGFNIQYNEQKELNHTLQRAVMKFNQSPEMGIKMLKSIDMIKNSVSVAKFLYTTPTLSKEAVGRYLGDPKNEEELSAYAFFFDFKGLELDEALRKFLQAFLLTGESQKIDRIIEKFAVKYCFDNPEKFDSSDTAHIISFSIILLNTDLHSANVKNKMQKSEFVRNNSHITKQKKVEKGFLENIYDRIAEEEITHDKSQVNKSSNSYVAPKEREEMFAKEKNCMKELVQTVVSSEEKGREEYINAAEDNVDIIYRMFEGVWSSSLASLSILMEKSEDARVISLCMETYTSAIKLATVFKMDLIKEAYINTLAGLTLLGTSKEMGPKNIKAIKTILDVALDEASSLNDSWGIVLNSVSHVERLHLVGSGMCSDSLHFNVDEQTIKLQKIIMSNFGYVKEEKIILPIDKESQNTKAVAVLVDEEKINRIFVNTEKLSEEKIVVFYRHLCDVAKNELYNNKEKRVFSLEKIVETICYNINRSVETWTKIWNDIANLFSDAANIPNVNISKYVINSYRVIMSRFLGCDKFNADETFQKVIFQPFLALMESEKFEIREIVLQCVFQLVQNFAARLNKGWHPILEIASIAAMDSREKIVSSALNLVQLSRLRTLENGLSSSPEIFAGILCFASTAQNCYLQIIQQKALEMNFHLLVTLLKDKNVFNAKNWTKKSPQNGVGLFCFGLFNTLNFIFKSNAKTTDKLIAIGYLKDLLNGFGDRIDKEIWKIIFDEILLTPLKNKLGKNRFENRIPSLLKGVLNTNSVIWETFKGLKGKAQKKIANGDVLHKSLNRDRKRVFWSQVVFSSYVMDLLGNIVKENGIHNFKAIIASLMSLREESGPGGNNSHAVELIILKAMEMFRGIAGVTPKDIDPHIASALSQIVKHKMDEMNNLSSISDAEKEENDETVGDCRKTEITSVVVEYLEMEEHIGRIMERMEVAGEVETVLGEMKRMMANFIGVVRGEKVLGNTVREMLRCKGVLEIES